MNPYGHLGADYLGQEFPCDNSGNSDFVYSIYGGGINHSGDIFIKPKLSVNILVHQEL